MRKYSLLMLALALSLFMFGCSQDNPTTPVAADQITVTVDKDGRDHNTDNNDDNDDAKPTARYEITVENLTPATAPGASQPFSPPILATHSRRMHIFQRRRYASDAVTQLAEDAVAGPLLDMLHASPRVHAVAAGDGVVLPGGVSRFEIEAAKGMRRLSVLFMLVNTNDAFGGLDGVKLPRHGQRTFMVRAWDAGSEMNTELMTDIPGPCCGSPMMGTDEHRRIRRHHGIMGVGDLAVDTYGWEGKVARVTVRRLDGPEMDDDN